MKKKKLTLLSAVSAAAVLAACTADELLSEGGKATRSIASADPTPIMVSALVDNGDWEDVAVGSDELHAAATRAGQNLNEGSLSTTVQSMALYAYGQSGNASGYTRYVLNSYNTSTKQFSATTMPVFPAGETSVNVYGWYPAVDSPAKTFAVQPDQSSDANFIKSDLMLANQASCTRTKANNVYTVTPAALTFRHVLSKINMNITPGEGVTITKVEINGVNRTATINDGTKTSLTATCSGNGSDAITVWTGTHSSGQLKISAVIPPQTLKNTFVTIMANTPTKSGKTATYSLGATGKSFATGKKYVMNLTVNQQDIKPQAHNISAWDNAGTVTIEGNATGGGGDIELSEYEKTLTVAGSSQTVSIQSGSGTYTVVSSNTSVATASVSGTNITISPVNAGVANVLVSKANGEYGIVSVTVNKGTPTVTPPTAVSGAMTYNKTAQTLFSGGSTTGGTLQFALGTSSEVTGSWDTSLPTATNAGTHFVWYKVVGDANYNDVAATKGVSKEIAKFTPTITLSPTSLSFFGVAGATKTFTVSFDGDNTLSVASSATSIATVSPGSLTSAGGTVTVTSKGYGNATITVSAAATSNCNVPANKTVAVSSVYDPGISISYSTVGMIVGANGKAYKDLSEMNDITTAIAVVVYKIGGTKGYAISLVDAPQQNWNTINGWTASGDERIVPSDCYGDLLSPPSGLNWLVLSQYSYSRFIPNGYNAINGYITSAGGTALDGFYWSCSEDYRSTGCGFDDKYWYTGNTKGSLAGVRPCLAF